ncbi:MAG TPA: YggT family protein [Burkholderiaceae bacterium]|nr:YggT family protein [Burkholderiaceae bacterium]
MFVDVARALLDILGSLLVGLLLLRAWCAGIGMPARNPLAHFARALTDWLVQPIGKVIPARGRIDWATLLAAALTCALIVIAKRGMLGLPIAPDMVVIEALRQLLNWALTLVIWITLIYVLISWVNPMAPVAPALSMLLQPLLGPIRRIVPTVGGIDLSPMVLLILVYLVQMVLGRIFL